MLVLGMKSNNLAGRESNMRMKEWNWKRNVWKIIKIDTLAGLELTNSYDMNGKSFEVYRDCGLGVYRLEK